MKFSEIIQEKIEPGTFAGVRLSKESQNIIKEFCQNNHISNPSPKDKLHITLLYSKKPCPDYKPSQKPYPMTARAKNFEIWVSEHIDGKPNCLVLKLECAGLVKRQKYLMDKHGATFDYDEYVPHITFSYDVGNLKANDIPKFTHDLIIEKEYQEDLRTKYKADDHPGN